MNFKHYNMSIYIGINLKSKVSSLVQQLTHTRTPQKKKSEIIEICTYVQNRKFRKYFN